MFQSSHILPLFTTVQLCWSDLGVKCFVKDIVWVAVDIERSLRSLPWLVYLSQHSEVFVVLNLTDCLTVIIIYCSNIYCLGQYRHGMCPAMSDWSDCVLADYSFILYTQSNWMWMFTLLLQKSFSFLTVTRIIASVCIGFPPFSLFSLASSFD